MTDADSSLLRRATDALEEIFFVFTPEGEILEWNRPLTEVTGYTDDEVEEMNPTDFVPTEEEGRIEYHIRTVLKEGHTRFESFFQTKQGQKIPYEFTGSVIEQDGQMLICGTGRNIAERKRAQAELEASNRRLEKQAEQAKKQAKQIERKNDLLQLTEEVARAANEAESFEAALQTAVDAVSDHTGWPVGHVYLVTGRGELVPTSIWNRGSEGNYEVFREATAQMTFAEGDGLIGQLLKSSEPEWIENAAEDPTFLRRHAAAADNLKGAFAFPVPLDQEVVAVLEFFSEDAESPDEELLEVMEAVGVQLGRVADWEEAKRELEASERRYRRLFEDSQEGIMVTTPGGDILEANPTAREIFGYSEEELLAMNATELYVDPEERQIVASELREEGAIVRREIRFRRADGKEIICEVSGSIGRRDGEKRWEAFFRDVTEQKKAEKALRESEEQFRTLAEGALVGITLIQDGVYKYINPMIERITGYSNHELIGESPKTVVHPEDWPQVRAQLDRRLDGKAEEVHYEARVVAKSGETRNVEVSGSEISYQGEPALIATVQDVTERRRMQRELIQVQEKERRRIGQDLHDSVASQLTGANLMLGSLSSKVESEDVKEGIRSVQDMIKESAGDMRRLSRGLNPGGLSEGDLSSALKGLAETTDRVRFEGLQKGREDELPSSPEAETSTHLYRMAQEAVANARRHGDADEIVIRLREEDGAFVILEVEDDGKGFDPSEPGNDGLGLRSMQHRAELLGAELEVDSSPGEGTLVRCRLPI